MKILHLSDLHIGKIIYEQSLLEDQEYMLKQIEKNNRKRENRSGINFRRHI